jgi:hypothetical protein
LIAPETWGTLDVCFSEEDQMKKHQLIWGVSVLIGCLALACEDDDGGRAGGDWGDGGPDADADSDGDGDSDSDADEIPDDHTGGKGSLQGRVMAPSGKFPISGALVYLSKSDPEPIPETVFHYECDNMAYEYYTLSGADGAWSIVDAPDGTWKIITRKGNFRRVREVKVEKNEMTEVPQEHTTLPGNESAEGDTIPNFAVLYTDPDLIYNLLGKFGMGTVGGGGVLQLGTESFDLFNDGATAPGKQASKVLFDTPGMIDNYHMLFLPCYSATNPVAWTNGKAQQIRDYVSKGGKIYNSCCVALWTEAAFPDYIDFTGGNPDGTGVWDIGRISNTDYSTNGQILDNGLSAWVNAVAEEQGVAVDTNNYPFTMGYVKIDGVTEVDDGHGLDVDDGWVKPYVWVKDVKAYPDSPLMVTYNYDGGKVFYTVYETSAANPNLTPQEYALIYVILEVGVCDNPPLI